MKGNYFPSNLKYLRTRRGLEQSELASLLGRKSPSSISEWEAGRYTPKVGTLSDIARIFNVDISDLMNKDLTGSKVDIVPISNNKLVYYGCIFSNLNYFRLVIITSVVL